MIEGSCLCGGVRWRVSGALGMMSNCHCSMCRKLHGAAFATYAGAASDDFEWLDGANRIREYESSPGGKRPFCERCGSVVAMGPAGGNMYMPAGNLAGELGVVPSEHIFVGSKAVWYEITDDIPRFDEYPEGHEGRGIERPERVPATPGHIGGSCLCGAVAYEFGKPQDRMGNCHCSRCRKSRSAAHSTQTFAATSDFRWLQSKGEVETFKLPESQYFHSAFCGSCGSLMPVVFEAMGSVMIPAGSLDQDPGIRPQAHIYVGSKAPWFEITDALPRFETTGEGSP